MEMKTVFYVATNSDDIQNNVGKVFFAPVTV